MVAQQAAAQQAARCFLALLRDVQSSPPAHGLSYPEFGSNSTVHRNPELCNQNPAIGPVSSIKAEDSPITAEMRKLNPRKQLGAEGTALLSEFESYTYSAPGLPQHSVGKRPVTFLQKLVAAQHLLPKRLNAKTGHLIAVGREELHRLPEQLNRGRRRLLEDDLSERKQEGRPPFIPTSKHVLSPFSNWVKYWDLWMGMNLIFSALVTPYQVAFLTSAVDGMFWWNLIVDASFIVDMGIQPFQGYWDEDHDLWVMDLREIRRRYLRSWFVADFIAATPYDVLAVIFHDHWLGKLQFLRLLRLAKLARVMRVQRFFRRWENWLSINYSTLKLASFITFTFVCAHWIACGMFLITSLEGGQRTWLTAYNENAGNGNVVRPHQIYAVALYWAVMTMSTIGYGDVQPQTTLERSYVIGCMVVGASVYAYMVGAVCGIVASMDPDAREFYGDMDTLNLYVKKSKLPMALRSRLRDFARYQHVTRSLQDRPYLLAHMSQNLQADVAAHTQARWLEAAPLLRGLPPALLVDLSLRLGTRSFSPDEAIFRAGEPREHILIVERGNVASRGRLLGAGGLMGLKLALMGVSEGAPMVSSAVWDHTAVSLSYVNVLTLHCDAFHKVLRRFPEARRELRQAVARSAAREGVLQLAKGLQWVAMARSAGVYAALPAKAQLGGNHITDRRYRHILMLLQEREPEFFKESESAAVMIQRRWRGVKGRRVAKHVAEEVAEANKSSLEHRVELHASTLSTLQGSNRVTLHDRADSLMPARTSPSEMGYTDSRRQSSVQTIDLQSQLTDVLAQLAELNRSVAELTSKAAQR